METSSNIKNERNTFVNVTEDMVLALDTLLDRVEKFHTACSVSALAEVTMTFKSKTDKLTHYSGEFSFTLNLG